MHPATLRIAVIGCVAWAALATEIFEDVIRRDFKMGLLQPRAGATLNQFFTGALGGIGAPAITQSSDESRPFEVEGSTFTDFADAAGRSCDNQHNDCANAANEKKGSFSVGQCDSQQSSCKSAINAATQTTFGSQPFVTSNAEFDFFCD